MKFSDYPYHRPDLSTLKTGIDAVLKQFEAATSVHEQIICIDKVNALRVEFNTMFNLCIIRHTIDTKEEFYNAEQDFFDANLPVFEGIQTEFYKALLRSAFRDELENKFGKQIFRIAELSLKTFIPEIIEDLIKENTLGTEYMELMAGATILFDGEEKNLAEMAPYVRSTDRSVRKKASEARWNFYETHSAELDNIFDELVKTRDTIAKKLGYKNFVQLGYDRMNRSDYDAEMVAQYRKQILQEVMPYASQLKMQQASRLGLAALYYYDEAILFSGGNATPKGSPEWIISNGKKMYEELSHETSEFIGYMMDKELMDLVAKKGKATGGYCTYMPGYHSPFIFSNFNGTSADIDVLTHEVGHAFQVYSSRNNEMMEYLWPTYDAAEIHSMSMEYFAYPWMHLFFNGEAEKYKYAHLVESITFLPYGAAVDEFQHVIYEQPELTPAERNVVYRQIEGKYQPHRNYEDNIFLNSGRFWQSQGHIYQSPFYYIDYTLAQFCAFQFLIRDGQNHSEAFSDYVKLCKAGGSKSFTELIAHVNLLSPFKDGCVAAVLQEVKTHLHNIDETKF
ncbi:MAG: M3 family oligoendopeptidase [Chitinophagales bacterium]|nr:M3 family oligoendopeptidase [Chitinophagales bacterium]